MGKVLHTGDCSVPTTRAFYFVARKDDIIRDAWRESGRRKSRTLYALAGIREAAVIGVPDAILGIPQSRHRSTNAARRSDVIRHCAKHLEELMIPKFVEFAPRFKTDSGKISRRRSIPVPGGAPLFRHCPIPLAASAAAAGFSPMHCGRRLLKVTPHRRRHSTGSGTLRRRGAVVGPSGGMTEHRGARRSARRDKHVHAGKD